MLEKLKTAVVVLVSLFLFGLVLLAFWFQDWQYSLPTPKPQRLAQPDAGLSSRLADLSGAHLATDGRPLFLHFFNPACPCSRFNLDHVRRLVHDHGAQIRFVAVVEGGAPGRDNDLHLPMPAIADAGGLIAGACGVYSTPQAVLLDGNGNLYYRGNYNAARYCTGRPTEFARLALESLLAARTPAPQPALAVTAYGCQLPSNPALPVAPGGAFVRFCRQRLTSGGGRKP